MKLYTVLLVVILSGCAVEVEEQKVTTPSEPFEIEIEHPVSENNQVVAQVNIIEKEEPESEEIPVGDVSEELDPELQEIIQQIEEQEPSGPKVIDIIAKEDEFTPDEIILQRNVPVELHITSTDKDHAVNIPSIITYVELPLGETVELSYTPRAFGEFPIICVKNCGVGQDQIKAKIKVV